MAFPFRVAVWAIVGVAAAAKAIHSYLRHSREIERSARIARGEHQPRFATGAARRRYRKGEHYGAHVAALWTGLTAMLILRA